ncbi:hypothetical protein [Pontibacter populi]|uniref:Uncharacterized protein n=1 Tax=Pontibacter populi TaxID=890055 RepID=A0ABV1RYU7_9BACT
MMKQLLTITLLALLTTSGFAQDVITKKNGEGVQAKVLEITPTEIKYKRFENPDGPIYTLAKTDVLLVKYENNTEEVFTGTESFTQGVVKPSVETAPVTKTAITKEPVVNATSTNLYVKGQHDAEMHYSNYKSAGTGVLVGSLLSPLLGLVPAIACSTIKPQTHNLNYPDHALMQDAGYSTGYTNKARQMKSRKVWRNWGIGLGVNIVLAIALAN